LEPPQDMVANPDDFVEDDFFWISRWSGRVWRSGNFYNIFFPPTSIAGYVVIIRCLGGRGAGSQVHDGITSPCDEGSLR
jgi:hypothetical protein